MLPSLLKHPASEKIIINVIKDAPSEAERITRIQMLWSLVHGGGTYLDNVIKASQNFTDDDIKMGINPEVLGF